MERGFVWHELPAVIASAVWVGACIVVCIAFGPEFDLSARLSLEELAWVATIASGVVAPVAVLWVVRSIHIQKTELANAVSAAREQAESAAHQAHLVLTQHEQNISPKIDLQAMSAGQSGGPGGRSEDYYLVCANVGRGMAVAVRARITGFDARDVEVLTFDDVIRRNLASAEQFTYTYRPSLDGRNASRRVEVTLEAERFDGATHSRAWTYFPVASKLTENAG